MAQKREENHGTSREEESMHRALIRKYSWLNTFFHQFLDNNSFFGIFRIGLSSFVWLLLSLFFCHAMVQSIIISPFFCFHEIGKKSSSSSHKKERNLFFRKEISSLERSQIDESERRKCNKSESQEKKKPFWSAHVTHD